MTKIRDYNMNGTIILGVDAGYGNYKTARCCFPTSVSRSDQPPVFTRNYLEYEGGYYTIGEGHKDFVAPKRWKPYTQHSKMLIILKNAEK